MEINNNQAYIFHILHDEALEIQNAPFGRVGKIYSGEGIEAVWVKKEAEDIDPDWFSQPVVDLILVVQGKLKVEFESDDPAACVLGVGDMLVLPAEKRSRAYRWPREVKEATVFLAVYPKEKCR